jgi:hypothetical protein
LGGEISHILAATESAAAALSKPPIVSGLIGHYDADSYNAVSKIWKDLSGHKNDATEISGNIAVVRPTSSVPYIQGDYTSWIKFPETVLPSTYTLFHVARYNGPRMARIFNGITNDWLSGFAQGRAGVAHHGCWITPLSGHRGRTWVVSSDRSNSFRSYGEEKSFQDSCNVTTRLAINAGMVNDQPSDFAVQIVLVYNRRLSDSEVASVERWLTNALCFSPTDNKNVPTSNSHIRVSFIASLSGLRPIRLMQIA